MLFAGWEVRIVKNCDQGLKNAAWGRRPRQHFQAQFNSFSLNGPTLRRQIYFILQLIGLTDYKWVCLRNFII